MKFLQSIRSFEYFHLHNIYCSFITDINRSGEDVAWGDRHGLSIRCGGNSRLSAVWKICTLPYLLALHNNWTYSSFHPFAAVQLVCLFLWDNKNKLMVHMCIVKNTTIFLIVRLLLLRYNYMFRPSMLAIFRLYMKPTLMAKTCRCTLVIVNVL